MLESGNPLTVYLSSFPRAGSTWLRFLIANVYNDLMKAFDEIDFFNIHSVVPEFGSKEPPFFAEFPSVIKTHRHYRALFRNCVLLLRDPYDLLYSYHDFLTNNKKLSIGLGEMTSHKKYGIGALVKHTNSYVRKCENLVILQYEGLKIDPVKELRRLFDFINFPVPDDILEDSVKKSTFLSMENIEREKGRKYGDPNFKHIRKGEIGVGRKELAKEKDLYGYIASAMKQSPILHLLYQ